MEYRSSLTSILLPKRAMVLKQFFLTRLRNFHRTIHNPDLTKYWLRSSCIRNKVRTSLYRIEYLKLARYFFGPTLIDIFCIIMFWLNVIIFIDMIIFWAIHTHPHLQNWVVSGYNYGKIIWKKFKASCSKEIWSLNAETLIDKVIANQTSGRDLSSLPEQGVQEKISESSSISIVDLVDFSIEMK